MIPSSSQNPNSLYKSSIAIPITTAFSSSLCHVYTIMNYDTSNQHSIAMALHFTCNKSTSLGLSLLFFLCLVSSNSSLSTFSVSETSNQTIVCALVPSSDGANFLNCTSQFIRVNRNASFSGVVSGDGFLCTVRIFSVSSTSVMHCWRFSANGGILDYKRIYKGPALQQISAGNSHICGIVNGTNGFRCWQWNEFNSTLTRENFSSIAVGEDFVCGLSATGKISCFPTGNNTSSIVNHTPRENYSVIAAGFRHVCAINVAGELDCWGDLVGEKPQGKFEALALGENRSCAMRNHGEVVCWGQNGFSLPTSLQALSFASIEAKQSVFCGVLARNLSLFCWGNKIFSSGSMVFERVLPGTCTHTCPCGEILPDSGNLCGPGQHICGSCVRGTPPTLPSPFSQPPLKSPPESGSGDWNGKMVALLVVGCFGSLALMLVSAFFLYKHCSFRGCRVHDSGRLDEAAATGQQVPGESQNPQLPPPPAPVLEKRLSQLTSLGNACHLEEFSLQILLEATDNFSEDRKIGTGSFGSVYLAILEDGRQVAVKRAEISNTSCYAIGKLQEDRDHAFINELESLSRLHHKNLVRLLGFCEDCNELVLVFEYMETGTLHDHLHKAQTSSPLMSWHARIKVALDAARGIEYLHEYAVPPIIHRDIKSSNILLDAAGTAKVSDFGLSLMYPGDDESHLSHRAAGTVGYIDPEYYRLQLLTKKSDVYSFGVVLLEILSGYRSIHRNENDMPRNVVDFVVPYIVEDEIHRVLDPKMPSPTTYEIEAVAHVGYLAADCVALEGRDRPSMTEIVHSLERALAACLVTPPLSRTTTASST